MSWIERMHRKLVAAWGKCHRMVAACFFVLALLLLWAWHKHGQSQTALLAVVCGAWGVASLDRALISMDDAPGRASKPITRIAFAMGMALGLFHALRVLIPS